MDLYVPILVMLVIAVLFGVLTSWVPSFIVGPRRYNRSKLDSYECGVQPTPQPKGGGRFPVKYYITAMTFIVFDIEVMFLYPWAIAFDELALFGFGAMALFLGAICIAYAYEWRRGGLEWD